MAGLIITAKAFQNQLKRRQNDIMKNMQFAKDNGIDPGYTLEDMMKSEMERIAADFRMQCQMAVTLRNIAIEEGLIKPPESETPKLLDDSPTLGDRYALITIRPEHGTCLVFFERKIAEFMERPWVLGAEYHFEQIGEDEATMGEGFHAHMVVKCKKSIRVPEIERDARKDLEPAKFSIQIGEKKTESRPNPRKFLKTERDLEYALNYVRGDKHNEDKVAAVELNETWRKLNGLKEVYYVGAWDNRESRPDAVIIEEVF